MAESRYKTHLLKRLRQMFPGCIILKNDSGYQQGIPDWCVLYGDKWAALEIKDSADARVQPNQPYYVELMGKMSFAAFIFPENESEVLHDLQRAFA